MGDENSNSSKACDKNKCNVVIVGAGMAGLSAANHLKKNGMEDFKILEARNRIGGRIVAIPLKRHNIELGANWIHGVLGNPIFEMAMANSLVNIINIPKPHKVIAATQDGKQVPFGILHEIYEAYVCFLRRCEEYFLCQYLPPPDIHSVGEHINLEATIYLERLPSSEEKQLRRLIFDCLLKRETCISGCHSMEEIDLLELGSYTELQGGNIMLPSGYSSILEPMTKHIEPEKIVTGCPVKKIVWDNVSGECKQDDGNESDGSDQTVIEDISKSSTSNKTIIHCEGTSTKDSLNKPKKNSLSHPIEISCENGDIYYANHVICTMPLGVLKEEVLGLFEPPLPQYKLESIDRLLFGTVDKIYLEYERPFLNPDITEIMLLWDDTDSDNLEKNWYRKIYSFSKVSETLLLGWVSGKEAEYMETLPNEEISMTCTKILRQFLNDPFVPEPQKCVW